MKKVEMYQAEDGSLHTSKVKACKKESILKEVKKLLKLLGEDKVIKANLGCNFVNGDGYFQLSKEEVDLFDQLFFELIKRFEPWILDEYKELSIRSYVLGRCLDDSNSPLYGSLITRLCVDSQYRRWGQIYFANNPKEAKQMRLE